AKNNMFFYFLYRIGQFLALNLPLKFAYKMAVIVSDIRLLFNNQDKVETKGNLKAIFPGKSDKEINKITKALFRNFAKYLVDFFRFSKIDKDYIEKNVEIKNAHYFDEALKAGQGVIALTAHIGNWELGGAVMGVMGYPLWAVALSHKHKAVDDFFISQRKIKGVNVIPLNRAGRQCFNCLKANKILALVGDRDFTQDGRIVDFFGKKSIFPEGPAVLSLKLGSPIVCGFMVRKPNDKFMLVMEKPIKAASDANNKEEAIKDLMKSYISIFEEYIRRYPDQWYMFKIFWI
ncbi:MAG: lysophospholipid acyltransferase family protein, partial [Candidatus Omnitrophica bacterium]|nr:lysophospholipid acyltransferase family protein [Candidatus Omnitrophota bacterium]